MSPLVAPGPDELLLLRACLLEGEAARDAFVALRPRLDLDRIASGPSRLLPLLHRNLARLGIDDPITARLRGVRHYNWARNRMRIAAMAPGLAALGSAGIPAMVLKGTAILATCHEDLGLRPMDDIDVLVPEDRAGEAMAPLAATGLRPAGVPLWALDVIRRRMPGFPLVDDQDQNLDLHWHLLHRDQRPGTDDPVWARARPAMLSGVAVRAPALEDQFLHVIVHAAEWNPVTPERWIADALVILRRAGAGFDWDLVAREAARRDVAPPLADAAMLLMSEFAVAVPNSFRATLARADSPATRREFIARSRHPARRRRLDALRLAFGDFRRRNAPRLEGAKFRHWVPFLGAHLRARGPRLPVAMAFVALGRPSILRHAWRMDTWVRPPSAKDLPILGTAITPDGEGRDAFLEGWSIPERTGRWTEGEEARLAWRIDRDTPARIAIEGQPLATATMAARTGLWANDHWIGAWRQEAGVTRRDYELPGAALAGHRVLVLTFAIEGAASPLALGLSMDARRLGFYLRFLRFLPPTA